MQAAARKRQQDRRRAVLDAAVRVFGERGYRAASMQDIAAGVGLSKPSLYHYVQSKEQVLVELYEEVMDDTLRAARSIVEADLAPLEALREVVIQRVVYTCENQSLLRVFFEEEAELPREQLANVLHARREYEGTIIAMARRGQADGSLVLPATPQIFVYALLGAANWVYKWYDPAGPLSPRALGEQIADAVLGGVTGGPAGA
jgi:AcrR family transcriptional regulator